jgi:hypothetical protein
MVKHFRNKNQDIQQLVEAFTAIMPQKIRVNMNLNTPHNYLLTADKDRIYHELI